jgi:hypothetical protein
MKRRSLLKLGLGTALLVGVAGGGMVLLSQPGLDAAGRLGPAARGLMHALAEALLDGSWPAAPAERSAAIERHLDHVDATIAALPAPTRAELSQLLTLLASAPGRLALAGLGCAWEQAGTAELQAALLAMRDSRLPPRQQVYQALRELHCLVFYTDPAHWALCGYPGPREIP